MTAGITLGRRKVLSRSPALHEIADRLGVGLSDHLGCQLITVEEQFFEHGLVEQPASVVAELPVRRRGSGVR
jgi:hypothetical protein